MNYIVYLLILILSFSCSRKEYKIEPNASVFLVVLGIAQDGGYPQIMCDKSCCNPVWEGKIRPEKVISLGLVDKPNNEVYLFDATPDFKEQLHTLLSYIPGGDITNVGGIFLTHAHIGHYTGLIDLGREAMGAKQVPVYAMPRMKSFLEQNGPWSQLVSLQNIIIRPLQADSAIHLTDALSITPILVPHRDEYSETVGFRIKVNAKSALFIPDIDKWQKWDRDIVEEVGQSTYAFLDATFFSEDELPGRDLREIPHPFVPETMQLFKDTEDTLKHKIVFIHFNHTNALLHDGKEYKKVLKNGFMVGRENMIFNLE